MSAEGWVVATTNIVVAAFIGWQARETRRAADATVDSLALTLDLSTEAVRARLDRVAPVLRVDVSIDSWPPLEPSSLGGEPQPLQPGFGYRMPRDAERRIALRARGEVVNDGEVAATVRFHNIVPDGEGGPIRPDGYLGVIPGGERIQFTFTEARTVNAWIENARARELGRALPTVCRGAIVSDDTHDEGVTDRWSVEMSGCPVSAISDDEGGWQVTPLQAPYSPHTGESVAYASVAPRERTYYLSKSANRLLPILSNSQ